MTERPRGPRKRSKTLPWSEDSLGAIRKRLVEKPRGSKNPAGFALTAGKGTVPKSGKAESAQSEEELFREAMADVNERPEFRRLRYRSRGRTRIASSASKLSKDLDAIFASEMTSSGEVRFRHTDEYMSGCCEGIRSDICVDLHAGRIPAQDHLDMHGMSLDEAKLALQRFIRDARARGLRCVNVIHGRGLRSPEGPVLKEGLRNWLETGSLRKWVLAYATAPRKQGGPGATYLLLR